MNAMLFKMSLTSVYNTTHTSERLIQNTSLYGPPSVVVTGTQLCRMTHNIIYQSIGLLSLACSVELTWLIAWWLARKKGGLVWPLLIQLNNSSWPVCVWVCVKSSTIIWNIYRKNQREDSLGMGGGVGWESHDQPLLPGCLYDKTYYYYYS